MTANTVYVAFPASRALYASAQAYIEAVQRRPGDNHQHLLDSLPHPFIDEVLAAFFERPVTAAGLQGSAASFVHGLVAVVGKASRALVGRVFSGLSPEEQIELARVFASLRLEREGRPCYGFRLDPDLAREAVLTFEAFRARRGEAGHLVRVMQGIGDGALVNFFDRPMDSVRTGMMTRGIVKAARATIHKASHSVARMLPALEPGPRQRVLDYFDGMLLEVPA